jgi:hypothetical protein
MSVVMMFCVWRGEGTPKNCGGPLECEKPGYCNPTDGGCVYDDLENSSDCDDGDDCTQGDTCLNGECQPGNQIDCTSHDQCIEDGSYFDGVCLNENKPAGTVGTDNNACTEGDTCQDGVCNTLKTCPPPDQCHYAAVCNTGSENCEYEKKPDGTSCEDGNACTQGDSCQNGICITGGIYICCRTNGAKGICGDDYDSVLSFFGLNGDHNIIV